MRSRCLYFLQWGVGVLTKHRFYQALPLFVSQSIWSAAVRSTHMRQGAATLDVNRSCARQSTPAPMGCWEVIRPRESAYLGKNSRSVLRSALCNRANCVTTSRFVHNTPAAPIERQSVFLERSMEQIVNQADHGWYPRGTCTQTTVLGKKYTQTQREIPHVIHPSHLRQTAKIAYRT